MFRQDKTRQTCKHCGYPTETGEHASQCPSQNESGEAVSRLWKRYGFPDQPPRAGTVAEQRLVQNAKDYIECVVGANTKKDSASDVVRNSSNLRRRELHNKLAIMIYGRLRSGMDNGSAVNISDFAAEIAYPGMTLAELEKINSGQK